MSGQERSVRGSQLITPFGVGAVIEIGGESFSCMDISKWPQGHCVKLAENNLERVLQKEIRKPPSEEQGAVPFGRFPRWLFCSSCRRLTHYTYTNDKANEFQTPRCSEGACRTSLVPMRFVAVCEHGHMQDVDWYWWAHRNSQISKNGQCSRMSAKLTFTTTGANGGDFNAMYIECACGAGSSFEGLTDQPYKLRCEGRQPWQRPDEMNPCSMAPRVHPRGASNVYYADSRSALDIGADVASLFVGNEAGLQKWLEDSPVARAAQQAALVIADWRNMPNLYMHIVHEACRQFDMEKAHVESVVVEFIQGKSQKAQSSTLEYEKTQYGFFISEWPFLSRSVGIQSQYLKTNPIELTPKWDKYVSTFCDQVTLISRLREVRALLGFRRLKPDGQPVSVDLGNDVGWLPGVEMFGEGIFLRFREPFLVEWEKKINNQIGQRMQELKEKCSRWGREPASEFATPRFIALHTFAHGLIRRLSFDAGYSSSSLRERVYARSGTASMAGILIYTSDGDSEGSLGGLVRQGQPERLLQTIRRSLFDLQWCSADPVCSELEHQGVDGLNAAACHACALVSETSCTFNNSLLDRRLLFGSKKDGIEGLFEKIIAE